MAFIARVATITTARKIAGSLFVIFAGKQSRIFVRRCIKVFETNETNPTETRPKRLVRLASELAGLSSVKNLLKDDVSGDWEAMAVRFIAIVGPTALRLKVTEIRMDRDIAFSIYSLAVQRELNRFQ